MTREDMIALARDTAARHDLPPELVCAVVEQESGWEPHAIRYEPAFYDRYVYPMSLKRAISETEARARADKVGAVRASEDVKKNFPLQRKGPLASAFPAPLGALHPGRMKWRRGES